jgi:WD40 repeat protein
MLLASGGRDGNVIVWDFQQSCMLGSSCDADQPRKFEFSTVSDMATCNINGVGAASSITNDIKADHIPHKILFDDSSSSTDTATSSSTAGNSNVPAVSYLAWSPNSSLLLACSENQVKCWDVSVCHAPQIMTA